MSSRDQKLSFWNLKQNEFNRIGAMKLGEDIEGMKYVNLPGAENKKVPYLITGGTDGQLKILDINSQKYVFAEEMPIKQEIERVYYLEKLNMIISLTNDQVLTYYDLVVDEATKLPKLNKLYTLCLYNDEIIDIRYLRSLDRSIVMCSNTEVAKIVNLDTQKVELLTGHEEIIIAVDTFGDYFVTGSKDKTCRIWKHIKLEDGSDKFVCLAICSGHNMSITGLSIEPKKGNYFVSSSQDNTIKKWNIYDIVTKDYLADPSAFPINVTSAEASEVAHDKYVNCVRISPGEKNKLVASASHDRTIKIWNAKDLSYKLTLTGHKRSVWDLAFSPFERILASASGDKTIKLWNVGTGQCLNTLEDHVNSTVKVVWIKQGLQLFSTSSDGTCKIWNIKKSTCVNTFDEHEDKVWAMDVYGDKLVTGGSDSKLIEWQDVTKEVADEEYKVKAEKSKEEHILSNMIYEGKYQEAAIQAFKLKKNRDLFRVIEMLLDQTKKKSEAKDPVMAVLINNKAFDTLFTETKVSAKITDIDTELAIKSIVKEMLKIDALRLLETIRDLNVHQKY